MGESAGTEATGRRPLLVLAVVSGLGGVVYEVLYMRHLTTVLGDMFYVHAGLLCTYLFAAGVGAYLAHRFVRWLFAFELAIGVYAFSLPWLLPSYEGSFLARLFDSPELQSLFASALLLAVPAGCIGFSIPLFSAYLAGQGSGGNEARDSFKLVYLLYNVGSAGSVVLAEFFLIRRLGFTGSLYVLGAANLACGGVLWWRRAAWMPGPRPVERTGEGEPAGRGRTLAAIFAASIGAAIFLGFYIKVCYHLFLPHRENFAICTAVTLFGIAVATYLARRLGWDFQTFVVLALVSLALVYGSFGIVAWTYEQVAEQTPASTATLRAVLFGGLLSLPYLFLGGTIPAVLQRERGVARAAGRLLFFSGAGNVAGMLLYIFVLHPELPVLAAPLAIGVVLGAALALQGGLAARPWAWLTIVASAVLLPFVALQPDERVYLVHDRLPPGTKITHYKAASDNVSFVVEPSRTYLGYNGHPSIHVRKNGVVNRAEIVSGLIPALVAPRRRRALVLGLGSGITAGATATMFEQTDVVEINAAFFPLLDRIAGANFHIADNPRATIVHDDARSFLSTAGGTYDAIVNSIPSPTYFAAGKIYTREFLQMVKRRLAPGGVYCSWFAPVDMSHEGLATFLATLSGEFAACNLAVLRNGYYFTSCGDRSPEVRIPAADEFPAEVREALVGVHGVDLETYFSAIFLSGDMLRRLDPGDAPINTDDFPIMEFQIMRRDRRSRAPRQLADPLVVEPDRFAVALRDPADEERFLEQALVLAQVHPPFFFRNVRPVLERTGDLGEMFDERWDAVLTARSAGSRRPAAGGRAAGQ